MALTSWCPSRSTRRRVVAVVDHFSCHRIFDAAFVAAGRERNRKCHRIDAPPSLFLLLILLSIISSSSSERPSSPFRIVIDAGSTGSRLHIFEMVATTNPNDSEDGSSRPVNYVENNNNSAPRIECLRRGSSKVWTPLSAFASTASSEEDDAASNPHNRQNEAQLNATHVAHHMLPLFDYASIIIPPEFHSSTPVRIAATAGMRLLPLEEQARVYDALHEGLLEQVENGQFTFTDLRRDDILTLNGEREGFYGAVAANYLRGVVDAELKVIVPAEDGEVDDDDSGGGHEDGLQSNDTDDKGLCTNKFGMCEPDAENVVLGTVVFGPSHHYVPQKTHDVKRHGPLGALDMGGSSTQIVYRHTADNSKGINESSNDVPSHLHDEEFFSTSYLSYGADQFRERLWDLWVSESQQRSPNREEEHNLPVIINPCSFVGYQMNYRDHMFLGTGDAVLCAEQVNRLIPHHDNVIDLEELYSENIESSTTKGEQQHRMPRTKMVGGVEHPPIRGKFYGMSLYFFTLDCLRELSDPEHPMRVSWPTPSIEELTHALDGFCARTWHDDLEEVQHEVHEHTRAEVLPHRCFEAVYMVTLLRDGFGFHPSSRDIVFTQWVEGSEVEWSLGMVLSEHAAGNGERI